MLVCPVCKTKTKDENQEYCLTCAWELEYYFGELSDKEKERYINKLNVHTSMYKKSINSQNIKEIKKKTIIEKVKLQEKRWITISIALIWTIFSFILFIISVFANMENLTKYMLLDILSSIRISLFILIMILIFRKKIYGFEKFLYIFVFSFEILGIYMGFTHSEFTRMFPIKDFDYVMFLMQFIIFSGSILILLINRIKNYK